MKKFILLFTSIYILGASSASAFAITGTAIAAAGVTLLPIVKPIAETLIVHTLQHVENLITGNTCFIGCKNLSAPYCKTSLGLDFCKGVCQRIEQIGGYELRIRFSIKPRKHEEENPVIKWSLVTCVRQGVEKKITTPAGNKRKKSIAVYSQQDLDDLLSLIAVQMAARKIVNTNGEEITGLQLRKARRTTEQLVASAAALVKRIDKEIKDNTKQGIYGNQ